MLVPDYSNRGYRKAIELSLPASSDR